MSTENEIELERLSLEEALAIPDEALQKEWDNLPYNEEGCPYTAMELDPDLYKGE